MPRLPLLACLPLLAVAACGGNSSSPAASGSTDATGSPGAGRVLVTATDTACQVSRTQLPAGTTTFTVTNKGSQVTEVYLYGSGDRIVAEKENITPGLSYDITAQLPAGSYQVACKPGMTGDGIRTALTVTGQSAQADPTRTRAQEQAVARYRGFVRAQADALVPRVEQFAAAVQAGDLARARQLYATSRQPWEAVEPVAESFGDLDPRLDLREADLVPGQQWTGWHRLEKALWTGGTAAGLGPVADQLLSDVRDFRSRVETATLTPASIGSGAKELLDEVATHKLTGEEEAFSHADLVDVAANVRGAREALTALRPLVQDQALLVRLDAGFAAVQSALQPYRRGSGFVSYDGLTQPQRRDLARAVDGLGEPLSRLAAAAV